MRWIIAILIVGICSTAWAGARIRVDFPCDEEALLKLYEEEGLNMRPYSRTDNPDSDGFIDNRGGHYYVNYYGIPDYDKDLRIQMKVLRGEV